MCYSNQCPHEGYPSGECHLPYGAKYPCEENQHEESDGNAIYDLYKAGHISLEECRRRMNMV